MTHLASVCYDFSFPPAPTHHWVTSELDKIPPFRGEKAFVVYSNQSTPLTFSKSWLPS